MSSELTLEQAALAWAQGKRVEARPAKGGCWKPIDNIGECDAEKFSQSVFGFRDDFEFRLAPEPPAKKFRPWTPEEVPVGVKMREKGREGWFTPTCAGGGEIETLIDGCVEKVSLTDLCEGYEHSTDGVKTWLPCGVEVDA